MDIFVRPFIARQKNESSSLSSALARSLTLAGARTHLGASTTIRLFFFFFFSLASLGSASKERQRDVSLYQCPTCIPPFFQRVYPNSP